MTVSDVMAADKERQAREERRARFRSALALARSTAKQWAADNDVSETHLYLVLKGERDSTPLITKIDAFIALWLPPTRAGKRVGAAT